MSKNQTTETETEQRLQKLLRSAFDGPPTPLKEIPKKNGSARSSKRASIKGASSSEERARSEN
jgi:hypothetical protein